MAGAGQTQTLPALGGRPRELPSPRWHRPLCKGEATERADVQSGEQLSSRDGAIAFSLSSVGNRLFVQRTHRNRAGTVAIQCLVISDRDEFRNWCEVEPTRFEDPVVFDRLRRYGDDVLGCDR